MPIKDRFGRFQVGGPLGGREGALDRIFDIVPGVGDIRALARGAKMGSETQIQPDLMGGAKATAPRRGAAAFEIGTALPVVGDVGAAAKLGASLMADYCMLGSMGKIVFHGSPHKFDKFDHAMMGSGEGAQAYGWGTYLADQPGVARTYIDAGPQGAAGTRKVIGQGGSEVDLPAWVGNKIEYQNIDQAIYDWADRIRRERELMDRGVQPWIHEQNIARMTGELDQLKQIKAEGLKEIEAAGNLYEVDLPDDQIAKMLDWDAPLSEQPEAVKKALRKAMPGEVDIFDFPYAADAMGDPVIPAKSGTSAGGAVYRDLTELLGSDKAASEALAQAGIPGIKYFDGSSRAAGEGTRNYVVFSEDILKIVKRNDETIGRN